MENRISTVLSPEDLTAIQDALALIRSRMPFLLAMSTEEAKGLPVFGDKSQAFVDKCLEAAQTHPEVLPRSLDVEEMRKDVQLFEQLRSIGLALDELANLVTCTTRQAGAEAYSAALVVYQSVKRSGDSSLDPLLDELARRFARKSSPKAG